MLTCETGKVDMVINTPLGRESFDDEKSIRRAAIVTTSLPSRRSPPQMPRPRGIRALVEHSLEVSTAADASSEKSRRRRLRRTDREAPYRRLQTQRSQRARTGLISGLSDAITRNYSALTTPFDAQAHWRSTVYAETSLHITGRSSGYLQSGSRANRRCSSARNLKKFSRRCASGGAGARFLSLEPESIPFRNNFAHGSGCELGYDLRWLYAMLFQAMMRQEVLRRTLHGAYADASRIRFCCIRCRNILESPSKLICGAPCQASEYVPGQRTFRRVDRVGAYWPACLKTFQLMTGAATTDLSSHAARSKGRDPCAR